MLLLMLKTLVDEGEEAGEVVGRLQTLLQSLDLSAEEGWLVEG